MPALDVLTGVLAHQHASDVSGVIPAAPNPALRHLRVEVQGRPPALMVLAHLEPDPRGQVEVWYSSKGEILRLQGGRIVGSAGLELDWRAVHYHDAPPSWQSSVGPSAAFERSRDVMPGYRFSVRERLVLSKLGSSPPDAHPTGLPESVTWYQERVIHPDPAELPSTLYAVARRSGQAFVMYSRQCLSASLCLHLQPWPVPSVEP